MTLEQKVHGLRLHVIQRAATLGNVSRACREAGISRTLFYRWQKRRYPRTLSGSPWALGAGMLSGVGGAGVGTPRPPDAGAVAVGRSGA